MPSVPGKYARRARRVEDRPCSCRVVRISLRVAVVTGTPIDAITLNLLRANIGIPIDFFRMCWYRSQRRRHC